LTGNTYNGIGIHPQSTLPWGGSLWNFGSYVIGTNVEQNQFLRLGLFQAYNYYTGQQTGYNEQIGVVSFQSVGEYNAGQFTGQLAGFVGEDSKCNLGIKGGNTFDQTLGGGIRTYGCNGTLTDNQFIGPTSGVEVWNPSHVDETHAYNNVFTSGAHFKGEAIGGIPYNNTQPIRFRVNDNSFTIPNGIYKGTDAITFKGLIAEKASTRKVMAHGNTISFNSPGLWETGIYAENCPEVLIAANDISCPTCTTSSRRLIGIHVNNSSDGDVANNYLNQLHDGIRISGVQTAVNYLGTQYTCNTLNACNFGMYFNGADVENQGGSNFSAQNQFFSNGGDVSGSILSQRVYFSTNTFYPSGNASNLVITTVFSNANLCPSVPSARTDLSSKRQNLSSFPNPIHPGAILSFTRRVSGDYVIMNLQGQILLMGTLIDQDYIPDFPNLASGTYYLIIENETVKILVY
jgi:hypothetical protein